MKSPIELLKFCLAFVLATSVQAAVREEWVVRHSLSVTGANQAVSIALDAQGNVIVGGHGTSTNGDTDYVVLKYAPAGTLLWRAQHGTTTNDTVRGMAVDHAGAVVLTGTGDTVKWGADGTQRWNSEYGGRALALDPSGDVYVTGFDPISFSTVKLHHDYGTNLWLRKDKVLALDRGRDISQVITVDSRTNVFVAGEVTCYWDSRSAYSNRRVVAYDFNGNLAWSTIVFPVDCYSTKVNNREIKVNSRGEVIVTGNVYGIGQTYSTVAYSQSGSQIWSYYLDSADFEGVQAMCIGPDNAILLTGSSGECVTVELGTNGVSQWESQYGSTQTGYHFGNAIALDSAGNVYVTGQSPGVGTGNDYATIKYSPSGQELWVQRYDGPAHGDDVATAIAVTPDDSVYVTGWSTTSSDLVEITTIKYVQTAGLTVQSNREVNLQFPAAPGSSNRVQATTDFLQWLDLGFSVADTNGLLHFLDTNAPSHSFRFYRAVTP